MQLSGREPRSRRHSSSGRTSGSGPLFRTGRRSSSPATPRRAPTTMRPHALARRPSAALPRPTPGRRGTRMPQRGWQRGSGLQTRLAAARRGSEGVEQRAGPREIAPRKAEGRERTLRRTLQRRRRRLLQQRSRRRCVLHPQRRRRRAPRLEGGLEADRAADVAGGGRMSKVHRKEAYQRGGAHLLGPALALPARCGSRPTD